MLLTAILAWLHVFSAILWLGGGIMFIFIVAPGVRKMTPPASGEFFVTVAPRVARFFQIVAVLTVVFGAILLYNLGGLSLLNPSTTYGLELITGISFAAAAFVMSEFVAVPPIYKAIRLIRGMMSSATHEPPPELPATLRLVAITGFLVVALLILASMFMVAAGFY
jgi:uncharacterized membrane protein